MNRRSGFTLIETLIATSLAAFLLAVVWAMFDIYTKLEDKGVRAAERATVVRAIERQFRRDLMQLTAIDSSRPSPIDQNQREHRPFPSNGYFFGTPNELHFVANIGSGKESLRVISYSVDLPESDERLDQPTTDESSLESSTSVIRLERSWEAFRSDRLVESNELSRFTGGREIKLQQDDFLFVGMDQPEETAQEPFQAAEEVRDDIPEISEWSFRYFDGHGWHDRWDSGWHRRAPVAFEIRFDTNSADERTESDQFDLAFNGEESIPQHRFVISLGVNREISTRENKQ